ncbi:Carbamoyltransferase (plasmid) [Gemmatirosa kalamazoonensis]|uniref:Carbamoyltransferase n=1 Tax=Gemmatirosa kalamazoonensis TaxID=861299 RepID=W0RRG4_9BACT|nr:carbamoyltransferase [Gemmatirosa kalamazoonensis]AHG93579.1 Carbamoyltransferase [Gemmatirosa kalamazoonensis]
MAHEYILGISAYYHDSAAALLRDGEIVAAAQEERFTRKKGDERFPTQAVAYCLREAGIGIEDVAHVGFYDKPLLKFERILETYFGVAPKGFRSFLMAGPLWIKEKLFTDRELRAALGGWDGSLLYAEHHESHAASAFYPSPFEEAAILTMDGVGEWATASIGVGRGRDLTLLREMRWPDSLGLLYSAFTYYTGFKVNSGEYKVMGLAPYGRPTYVDRIYEHLVDLRDDGSFTLNQKYFDYLSGLTMTSAAFDELFGGPPRVPESKLTQKEMDLARSVQEVTEEIMLRMARTAHRETGLPNLCLAGGVALNCVGNGRLLREGPFERIWIQPASGDAGGALGVAQLIHHRYLARERRVVRGKDTMKGAYLGPSFGDDEIEAFLKSKGASYRRMERDELLRHVAEELAGEKIVGWFNGRMEFGPRALGSRSILGDPRSPRMQAQMNLKIKFREGFRPFAPSVLREDVADWFELDVDSPYMLLVAPVKRERQIPMPDDARQLWGIDQLNIVRSDIPAVTHIDYSARVQTVSRETNPDYHDLIAAFRDLTGCPVVVNTSFNVRGEPIVCTPEDAYRCFMRTHIDGLVLGPFVLHKAGQGEWKEETEWQREFQLD